MMKKILITISILFATVFAFAQTQKVYTSPEDPAVISTEVKDKLVNITDWASAYKSSLNGTFPLKADEVMAIIKANKNKSIFKTFYGDSSAIFPWAFAVFIEQNPEIKEMISKLPTEEKVEICRTSGGGLSLYVYGLITSDYFVTENPPVLYWVSPKSIPNYNHITVMAENEGSTYDAIAYKVYSKFLAKGCDNKSYTKWFKAYLKNAGVEKAKELIKAELIAFVEVANPANKEQSDWLTQLRVLNTTYSEL